MWDERGLTPGQPLASLFGCFMTVPSASPDDDDFADFEDAFFRSSEASNGADSIAPSELDQPLRDERSQGAQLPHRIRLRKVVGLVVGASAVATLFVILRVHAVRPALPASQPIAGVATPSGQVASVATAIPAPAPVPAVAVEPVATAISTALTPPAPAAAVEPVVAAIPTALTPPAPAVAAEPVATAIPTALTPPAPAVAVEPVATAIPAALATAERKEVAVPALSVEQTKARALRAVSSGRYAEGIALSQAAIDADPTDAQGYLLLGAALQEKGQAGRAEQVFAECASKATHGPKGDCRALARH